jgi:hypothetical protein
MQLGGMLTTARSCVAVSAGRCIQWLQLSTNHTKTLAVGNDKLTAPSTVATVNRKAGYLAAIRGWQDAPKGGLQQLQFVWGVAVWCAPVVCRIRGGAS